MSPCLLRKFPGKASTNPEAIHALFKQLAPFAGKTVPQTVFLSGSNLEDPVLTPKPFVFAQKVLVRVGQTGLIKNHLHPYVQGRKSNP